MSRRAAVPTDLVSIRDARRLLLAGQGLLAPPDRPATRAELRRLVGALGYVQVDSIQVVERAHHLTLASRLDGYRPAELRRLLEVDRALFEHWTHDASIIPTAWYAHWKPRFRRDAARLRRNAWWAYHLGAEGEAVVAAVRERIAREGPLRSADFDHPGRREAWWGWKPPKAALEYLWRTGELAVVRRDGFEKVYDLTERVLPRLHALAEPDPEAHLEWACAGALERLGVATPRELAAYFGAVRLEDARAWCLRQAGAGRIAAVAVAAASGPPRAAYAVADWRARARAAPPAPRRMRLLSPFDPILRDRDRALRRFGFDYRFEAFVPPGQRRYGYYVLPLLDGEALVGRADAKLHRERGALEIRGLWWEPGVSVDRARRRRFEAAVARLAAFLGAGTVLAS